MAVAGSITLTAYDRNGSTDTVQISDGGNLHITVEFIPGIDTAESPDLERIVLSDDFGLIEDVEVHFDKQCTPADPFYIRWINASGGFEYQMFDQHKAYEDTAAGFTEFFPSFPGTPAAVRTRELLGMTGAKQTVTVGLEQVDRDDFNRLAGLIYSPRIDTWNVELERWEGVTLDSNTKAAWDTHGTKGAVEYTFRLKDVQLQF